MREKHKVIGFLFISTLLLIFILSRMFSCMSSRKRVHIEFTKVGTDIESRFTLRHSDISTKPKIPYPPYLKILQGEAYLYSAILISHYLNVKNHLPYSIPRTEIVINGWERKANKIKPTACCTILKNGKTIIRVTHIRKVHFYLQSKFSSTQFRCPTKANYSNVLGVTITYTNTCTKNSSQYITITLEGDGRERRVEDRSDDERHYNSTHIGICAKVAYGNLDARRLVEWFEVHRLFGVDMIIAYSYNLNSQARKVFSYYEKLGISKLFDFDIPEKDDVKRDVGVKKAQSWSDEQVALYDCQERLYHYDYVAVVDTDEFLIPKTNNFSNAWKEFFERKFQRRLLSAIMFKVQIHVTTWDKRNHPLFIGQYTNGTKPMHDRIKQVYMPSRIKPGTVFTHGLRPLRNYTKKFANSAEATIHHFRLCRKAWLKEIHTPETNTSSSGPNKTNKCDMFKKRHCPEVGTLANVVQDQVLQALKNIGLQVV